MKVWLFTAWERLRASYWFIPAVMTLMAVGLSYVTTTFDHRLKFKNPNQLDYIYSGGAEGARQLFGSVASSMITVAGVVFSLTVVTLTLAAQQFGSRLLYNFMRDTGNQIVLGTFVSTYVFCLLALRTVRGGEDHSFVPHVSVTVAVVLALASVGVLIYFIHHVATSINPANIIAAVGHELDSSVDHLYPEKIGEDPSKTQHEVVIPPNRPGHTATPIYATHGGYVKYLDGDSLLNLAKEHDWLIRTQKRPGSLVMEGDILADVHAAERPSDDQSKQAAATFVIGHERTSSQDIIFPINQIVQVAQRALSPGINDPHTALLCVDRLGLFLARLARRDPASGIRTDSDGNVRLITRPHTFAEALDASFSPIREYAIASVEVTARMLEILAEVGERAKRPDQQHAIAQQVRIFEEAIAQHPHYTPHDRQDLMERAGRVLPAG